MNNNEHEMARQGSIEDDGGCESPVGEIDLGRPPAIGRRARLLAGLTTGTAAVVMLTLGAPETGTTHSGPLL